MRKIVVFNNVSVDGYFCDSSGGIAWVNHDESDAEFTSFVAENAKGGGILLFGRVTYQLMAAYWPTARAMQESPVVAERMNSLPKLVFSRTLDAAPWSNTRLVKGSLPAEVRRLKETATQDIAILGSGSIVRQLTEERLIDEYHLVVNPVVLGGGRTMFEGVRGSLRLKRTHARAFGNGNVLLSYQLA